MKNNKKKNILFVLLLLIVGLSVGYALLSTNLKINGSSKIKGSSWDIHFENVVVNTDSVALTTGDVAATISTSTTEVSYTVTLNKPGDFYEFTVDAVNDGSVDGMIESVTSKLNDSVITTLPAYLNYSVSYSDGVAISPNQYLKAGESETYKVRVEFKKDIENNELPTTAQTLTFRFEVVYVQADENAKRRPKTFADDDWDVAINTLKSGSVFPYEVGDEKEVYLGTFGKHKLRIANSTTPAECSAEGFSQTACGVVLEFVDSITDYTMNSSDTNIGGWKDSELRGYLSNEIYNTLPSIIKDNMVETRVVSSHGKNESSNFITTDKLYLLSSVEVWGDNSFAQSDSSNDFSRQLDYYRIMGVNNYNYSGAMKGLSAVWWLRSAASYNTQYFRIVFNNGSKYDRYASISSGVSPAFRIA